MVQSRIFRRWCLRTGLKIGLPLLLASGAALGDPVADYRLKAAIVYNFALFTTWPADALPAGNDFNVCFLQAPELKQGMQELAVPTLLGRRLVMQLAYDTDGLLGCQVLVVGALPREKWNTLRKSLAGAAVLTVSDEPALQDRVMMSMATEGDRIVFDVDHTAARAAQLAPSSKLLRLARKVR